MANKKKQSKNSKIFWRISISAVGVALILIAVFNILLFLFGESVSTKVNSRRFGGADDGKPFSQRYSWSLDYTFVDKEGIIHSGHTTRRGSDMSVKTDSRAYYFTFAPFINSLESEVNPNIGQVLFIGIGIFLIFVMNKKKKKVVSKFKVTMTQKGEKDVPELNDYDDSVEEVFQEDE